MPEPNDAAAAAAAAAKPAEVKPAEGAAAAAGVPAADAGAAAAAPAAAAAAGGAAEGDGAGETFQPKPSLLEQAGQKKADEAAAAKAAEKPAGEVKKDEPAAGEKKPDDKAVEAKPGEAKKDDKPAEAKPAAEAAPPPVRAYQPFTVPEGLELDKEVVGKFTTILDDAALDHQQRGQKLVDLYTGEAKRFSQEVQRNQIKAFVDLQQKWVDAFVADPELGGNRQETSLANAFQVIEEYGGTMDQKKDLFAQLSYTGLGNNLGMIRLLNNIMAVTGEPKPLTPNPPKISAADRRSKWYGGRSNGGA